MRNRLPSLITPDAQAGLELAARIAVELHAELERASSDAERPGGMNYLLPASVPKEITAGIVFYAIAAANHGWASGEGRSS